MYTAKNERDVHPYLVEGIGKDTWPETMDPKVVDEWVRVGDRESFLWARRLAREEGILAGGSAGTVAVRGGPDRAAARPRQARAHDDPGLGPQLPVEVLRRQLDARARLPRAPGAAADGRGGAAREARRRASRPRHDLVAPEGRRGHRHDAALQHLAAAGRARRRVRVARRRHRLAPGPRAARARLREPGRPARGRRVGDAAAARRRRRVGDARRGLRARSRAGRTRSSSPATASRSACSRAATCSSSSRTGAEPAPISVLPDLPSASAPMLVGRRTRSDGRDAAVARDRQEAREPSGRAEADVRRMFRPSTSRSTSGRSPPTSSTGRTSTTSSRSWPIARSTSCSRLEQQAAPRLGQPLPFFWRARRARAWR